MATELADAHIERCKEEVEVLEEPIGVAGASDGMNCSRTDSAVISPSCFCRASSAIAGERFSKASDSVSGEPRPRTISAQSGGGYSRLLAHLFRHAVDLLDICIQLFVKLHFALSRCLQVAMTMVLRKCAP